MATTGTKPWPVRIPSASPKNPFASEARVLTAEQEATVGNKNHTSTAVVIIGAGISGICTAIDLIKRNRCHNFIILEKSSGFGGTWRDNAYPGCCCDVWSQLYSYSFEQNSDWTREYPGQEEILSYILTVVQKWGLFKYIRFNTSVKESQWDEATKQWKTDVEVAGGSKDSEFQSAYTISSDFLVSAVGQLNSPRYPDIKGLGSFQGRTMHSARWDWTYDFDGKRIAIIGNGATAAQILPEVALTASQVTIYQRSPNWVMPRLDADVSPLKRAIFKYLPPVRWRARALLMDIREAFYDAVINGKSDLAELIRTSCVAQMQAALPDQPELWQKLTPEYNPGCKRVIISDDYYPALARSNVAIETRPISQITSSGIEVEGDSADFDLIVLATGFRTVEFMHPIALTGRQNRTLAEVWKDGALAFNGTSVPDLPNFAMLYGPNTNLGHNSIILMIEAQSRYINALIGAILDAKRQGLTLALTPKDDVTASYNQRVQSVLAGSSFADPKCNSWYKNAAGRITNNWSGTVIDYQKQLSNVEWNDFEAEGTGVAVLDGRGKTTQLGRVVEETQVSNLAVAVSAVGALAVAAGWILRNQGVLGGLLKGR